MPDNIQDRVPSLGSYPSPSTNRPPVARPRVQLRTANAIARRMTETACAERRAEVDALLDQGVRFLAACKDAGMSSDYIEDTAKGFHDKLADLMAGIDRDLDGAGLWPAQPLCLVELAALTDDEHERLSGHFGRPSL